MSTFRWAAATVAVATTTAALVAVGTGGAEGGAKPIAATPERESGALGCGTAPTMVISSDLYVKAEAPATTPEEAIDRLVGRHNPNAPRGLFRRAQENASQVKYHVRNDGGRLLASFLVDSVDGEYYVGQIALCESTAKRWAR